MSHDPLPYEHLRARSSYESGLAIGEAPAIVLCNPKFPHNVGGALRAASCFGVKQVWYTGDRVSLDPNAYSGRRLPREERMKGYKEVQLVQYDRWLDCFSNDVTPVAVEVLEGAEYLHTFEHPKNAVYVFGPEDGSINGAITHLCHRFVVIPTRHCVNLSAAVYLTLYDRTVKALANGAEMWHPGEVEDRGMSLALDAVGMGER